MPGTYDEDAEKYIIYNVTREEYETCRITNPDPKIIAICDKPYKLMYFTITFRPFTPQPGGLEFQPGKDYYFICEYLNISLDFPAKTIRKMDCFYFSLSFCFFHFLVYLDPGHHRTIGKYVIKISNFKTHNHYHDFQSIDGRPFAFMKSVTRRENEY